MAEHKGEASANTEAAKRKADDAGATPKVQKKKKAPAALVSLKNSRLSLRQKNVVWDRTMPVLRGSILAYPSDKSSMELARIIRATLLPEGHQALDKTSEDGQALDVLPVETIQMAIEDIAVRRNYGLDTPPDVNYPSSLCIWRWEVIDTNLLPKENLPKLLARREEREQAKLQAIEQFDAMPEEARQALLEGRKPVKNKASEITQTVVTDPEREAPATPETPVSSERVERSKQKESRKAEKQAKDEKVEKNMQAQKRLFNSFFQQPSIKVSPKKQEEIEEKNDFQRTFLPCEYRNMANLNPYYHSVDDSLFSEMDARKQSIIELRRDLKGGSPAPRARRRGIYSKASVRDIMKCVQESDVLSGNAEEHARHELEKLNNRRLLPIKLLQFQSDRRPGWIGTWSRSSSFITPRKPFGQDPVALDYSYDSDAEWEEVDEGENVDAVDDKEEEDSAGGSENEDSEMDDWLEDDLEEDDEAPITRTDLESSQPTSAHDATAKSVNVLQPKKKVKLLGRRFESKLVPYVTGPHWEATLAEPTPESLIPYRIQFLNDAFLGLDPFTYTSTTISVLSSSEEKKAQTVPSETSTQQRSNASGATPTPSRQTKMIFPDTHLPELLNLVQGSTRSKPALLEDLREHFGPIVKGISKAAIENRLQECATRESKKPGSKWVIRPEWKNQLDTSVDPN
ncbi:hypothetical protein MPSI1_001180 [Malassezia psittaci]|uniref:Chromatin assembly factor 1 subunit A n=1 Tax=Malassezia psittaci TaxID=1821823 RepID=A0AAF0F8X3_9BASI|nr:hypothetical protein MPSI1_001180 [Malassezia psittaci]